MYGIFKRAAQIYYLLKIAEEKEAKYLIGLNRKALELPQLPEENARTYNTRLNTLAESGPVFSKRVIDFVKDRLDNDVLPQEGRKIFIKWLANELEKEKELPDVNQIAMIKDWLTSIHWPEDPSLDLSNLTFSGAVLESNNFHQAASSVAVTKSSGYQKTVIRLFDNGLKLVYEPTDQECKNERKALGKEMGLCLAQGMYGDNQNGKIYSIRNDRNKVLAVMRVKNNVIMEIKGKNNLPPADIETAKAIKEWVEQDLRPKHTGSEFSEEDLETDQEEEYSEGSSDDAVFSAMGKKDYQSLPPTNWQEAEVLLKRSPLDFIRNGWFRTYRKEFLPYMIRILNDVINSKRSALDSEQPTLYTFNAVLQNGGHYIYKDLFEAQLGQIAAVVPLDYFKHNFPKTFGVNNPANKIAAETLAARHPSEISQILYPWHRGEGQPAESKEAILAINGIETKAASAIENQIDKLYRVVINLQSALQAKDEGDEDHGLILHEAEKFTQNIRFALDNILAVLNNKKFAAKYPNLLNKITDTFSLYSDLYFQTDDNLDFLEFSNNFNNLLAKLNQNIAKGRLYRLGGSYQKLFDRYLETIKKDPGIFFSNGLHNSKEYRHLTNEMAAKVLELEGGYNDFFRLNLYNNKQISQDLKDLAATQLGEEQPTNYFLNRALTENPNYDNFTYNTFKTWTIRQPDGIERMLSIIVKYLSKEKLAELRYQDLIKSLVLFNVGGGAEQYKCANAFNLIDGNYHTKLPFLSSILLRSFFYCLKRTLTQAFESNVPLQPFSIDRVFKVLNQQLETYAPELAPEVEEILEILINNIEVVLTNQIKKKFDWVEESKEKEVARKTLFKLLRKGIQKDYPKLGQRIAGLIKTYFKAELEGSQLINWKIFGGKKANKIIDAFEKYYYSNQEYQLLDLYEKDEGVLSEFKKYLISADGKLKILNSQNFDLAIREFIYGFMMWSLLNLTDGGEAQVVRVLGEEPGGTYGLVDDGYNFRARMEQELYPEITNKEEFYITHQLDPDGEWPEWEGPTPGLYPATPTRKPIDQANPEVLQDLGYEPLEDEFDPSEQFFDDPNQEFYDSYEQEPNYTLEDEDVENYLLDSLMARNQHKQLSKFGKDHKNKIVSRFLTRRDRKQQIAIINYLIGD